jgi:hypothetical protein
MTNKTKSQFRLLLAMLVVFATIWSCQDEDPTLDDIRQDKLAFLEDSLRISDSLRLINSAGVVNYSITVVDGSTSTIFKNGGTGNKTEAVDAAVADAIVTVSQFGKTESDTTDASGTVVFRGFFRTAINVTIRRADFTTVSYVTTVGIQNPTVNGTLSFVGNLIPIFPTAGPRTATISGRMTIQTDLTNRTRETVADNTPLTVSIDAKDSDFRDKYLMSQGSFSFNAPVPRSDNSAGLAYNFYYVGNIAQASYGTGVIGNTTGGNGSYSINVPTAIDGLPLSISYSDIAADQTLFQEVGEDQNRITQRVIFRGDENLSPAALPSSGSAFIDFQSFDSPASASAVVSANAGTIERINITNGGTGYTVAPTVQITGGGGSGASATAVIGANGRVTSVTIVSAGAGYTSAPTVTFLSGSGASASSSLAGNGTVTGVAVVNSGFGYTTAPTVTFSAPGGSGTTATGTATIDSQGRVTGVSITNAGSGYTSDPTVTFTAPPVGGTLATAVGTYSGQSVGAVQVNTLGSNYVSSAGVTITFSAPQRSTNRATGSAVVDPNTREVIGIIVTNAGSGYTSPPSITISAGSGATAQAFLTGGSIISFSITSPGSDYQYAPRVVIGRLFSGDGTGATGTAVMAGGRLVGITITNAGLGYTSAPSVELEVGGGAIAYANVDSNGAIASVTVANGGSGYTSAPRVRIFGSGSGATATATVNANGQITGVSVTNGGSEYEAGNTPFDAEPFSSTQSIKITTKPGLRYINDVHYGTGTIRQPN